MIKRTYKDSLFTFIFGREERKGDLLSLYNALNDKNYTNTEELTINTIEDVIYLGYKNDVSCIVAADNVMSLYEHQSTVNPNLPIRGIIYFSRLYEKYITKNNINIYSSKLQKLPFPEYYVFYIGDKEQPERQVLRFSDMFEGKKPHLECAAVVLNIHRGFNNSLLDKCKALNDYSYFIDLVYRYRETYDTIEVAIDKAVNECIQEGVLSDILSLHKAEVKGMLLTEFNEKEYIELVKKEEFESGKSEGIEIGKSEGIEIGKSEGIEIGELTLMKKLISEGKISREEGAKILGVDIEKLMD